MSDLDNEEAPVPKRSKRPARNGRRRSRQCRGRRARHYSRAVMREANGSPKRSNIAAIVADAEATGAIAAAQRLQERLAKQ